MTPPDRQTGSQEPSANVRVAPGLYFLAGLLVGFAVDLVAPSPCPVPLRVSGWIGGGLTLLGAVIAGAAMWTLKVAGTAIDPLVPTRTLVSRGVYGFSRNPIYLGLSVAYGGIALLGRCLWALGLLPLVLLAIERYAIRVEERYLEAKFGRAYLDYRARVRRWA
jgi:protein-S-isoprenylcysteine O-methyltransferase Ste14